VDPDSLNPDPDTHPDPAFQVINKDTESLRQSCGSGFIESGYGSGSSIQVNLDPDPGFDEKKLKIKKYK
jgi:hypothetical protein